MIIYVISSFSYMDMEQFEEAVRDYEKVMQLEASRGKLVYSISSNISLC